MAFLLHILEPEQLLVDVGANVGVYTVLAAGAAKARCLSLEPSPDTFTQLVRNIRLNGLEPRVEALQIAVGASEGTVPFTKGLGAMNRVATSQDGDVQEVPLRVLDDVVGDRTVSALKIDVEGFEAEVLRGASRLLSQPSLQTIIMERNGSGALYGHDEAALHGRLIELGFTMCRYNPFQRTIDRATDANSGQWGNALYIRDIERARQRVEIAPRYRVNQHLV
jgi:FkbM family methyltransferase